MQGWLLLCNIVEQCKSEDCCATVQEWGVTNDPLTFCTSKLASCSRQIHPSVVWLLSTLVPLVNVCTNSNHSYHFSTQKNCSQNVSLFSTSTCTITSFWVFTQLQLHLLQTSFAASITVLGMGVTAKPLQCIEGINISGESPFMPSISNAFQSIDNWNSNSECLKPLLVFSCIAWCLMLRKYCGLAFYPPEHSAVHGHGGRM